nr:hypothetical protein [Tanacetum cinerariifolium]
MSSSPSNVIVTYTSISSDEDLPSWGIPLMDAYESDPQALEATPRASEATPQSPEHTPLLPIPAPMYPEYLASFDDDIEPAKTQPLPPFVSPTALSLDYVADFEHSEEEEEDYEEDPKDDPKDDPRRILRRRKRSSQLLSIPHKLDYTLTYHLSDEDLPSWGIPLMDAYESDPQALEVTPRASEATPQSPEHTPLSPIPAPMYPEYLASFDDDIEPAKTQPLPPFVSPTALLLDYVADFEPSEEEEEDYEEDPKDDPKDDPRRILRRRKRSSQLLSIPHKL